MNNLNPFNFADLSDIAEVNPDLAKKVANAAQENIDAVVGIFKAAAEAGAGALSIAQLQVAAIRMGVQLPADATVRKYIKAGIEQSSLSKVTRQTYAHVDAGVAAEADANEPDPEDNDELAGI
jgi:hypothetical protein